MNDEMTLRKADDAHGGERRDPDGYAVEIHSCPLVVSSWLVTTVDVRPYRSSRTSSDLRASTFGQIGYQPSGKTFGIFARISSVDLTLPCRFQIE
jgi:hypothetical protein